MARYAIKSTELNALKITAVNTSGTATQLTFDDGTTTSAGIATNVVGDYAILLPSGNYEFIPAGFFDSIATAELTFEAAIAAIKSGKNVKRVSTDPVLNLNTPVFSFTLDDLNATDYEIVN